VGWWQIYTFCVISKLSVFTGVASGGCPEDVNTQPVGRSTRYMEKKLNLNFSGNEVDYTACSLLAILKIVLQQTSLPEKI
jgi:hypothetical protein